MAGIRTASDHRSRRRGSSCAMERLRAGNAAPGVFSWTGAEQKSEDVLEQFGQMFCISASSGSLIHATVGSVGGVGRPANRDGLAA